VSERRELRVNVFHKFETKVWGSKEAELSYRSYPTVAAEEVFSFILFRIQTRLLSRCNW
jgi:hypothetical protein